MKFKINVMRAAGKLCKRFVGACVKDLWARCGKLKPVLGKPAEAGSGNWGLAPISQIS